jgi:hypothetical protein
VKSANCIYCPSTGPMSKEHYLQYSLGRFKGFETLKDTVCQKCNNKIGHFEEQLKYSSPVGLLRIVTGAGVPESEITKQFYVGSHGTSPMSMQRQAPAGTHEILYEPKPGKSTCEIARQVCVIRPNGKRESIPVPHNLNSGDDIQRFVHHHSLKECRIHSAFFVAGERQLMESLLRAISQNSNFVINPSHGKVKP